jgi:hypothetical protein
MFCGNSLLALSATAESLGLLGVDTKLCLSIDSGLDDGEEDGEEGGGGDARDGNNRASEFVSLSIVLFNILAFPTFQKNVLTTALFKSR